jgi:hypothetical protein
MTKISQDLTPYLLKKVVIGSVDEFFDVTNLTADQTFIVKNDLSQYKSVSVQIEFKDLTGTLNGVIKLQQRNDENLSFVDIPTLTDDLDSASGSIILSNAEFLSNELAINIVKTGLTGGSIRAVLVAKTK